MAQASKVLNYNKDRVRNSIITAFKKYKGEAAVADIVAFTGLPKPQVDAELPAVADEYSGRLKVTESGEILYSFPTGFKSRYRGFVPSLRRFSKVLLNGLRIVSTAIFKVWIMIMLVGYFVFFIALSVLAILASVAGNSSSKNKSRGGDTMFAGQLINLFVRIWFYNEVFKSPNQRYRDAEMRAKRRPLSKAIFSFIFGEPDPNANYDSVEKQVFVSMVRQKKGIVLLEDFMAITGLSPRDADIAINKYMYEFEGTPEVSDSGTVYYHFPKLLMRSRKDLSGSDASPLKQLRPFSANSASSNMWYSIINGVNLIFGGYFAFYSLNPSAIFVGDKINGLAWLYYFTAVIFNNVSENPLGLILIALGVVPIVFSVLFWIVPIIRGQTVAAQNKNIKNENMRKIFYSKALASPTAVKAVNADSLPKVARPKNSSESEKLLNELVAYEQGDPISGDTWKLTELERKLKDVERLRASVNPDAYDLGSVAFDTSAPGDL